METQRFYIGWTSMWDVGPDYYPTQKIAAALKEAGAKNVRLTRKNGWCNQPKMVTFTVPPLVKMENLLINVQRRCKKDWRPIAYQKDW